MIMVTKPLGRKKNTDRIVGWLLVAPCAAVIVLMTIYPLIQVFLFSVSNVKLPFFETTFAGLSNFTRILSKQEFGVIVRNTVIWTVASLLLRFILGFSAALLMDTGMKGKILFRIAMLVPWVVPSIVAANTWRWIFNTDNGLLNGFLRMINPALTQNWLGSSSLALGSVIVAYVWMGFPFIMLMLVAGMQGIPNDYREAAQIDGANSLQVFLHVTLPCLQQIIVILIILEIISGFNSFDLLYTMTAGGPGIASEILGLYIFRTGFSNFDFSGASAIGVMLILAITVAFLFYVPATAKGRGHK